MSLACFSSFRCVCSTRRSELLRKCFFCVVLSAISGDSWAIGVTVYVVSRVSVSAEALAKVSRHVVAENVFDDLESLFCPSPCLCRQGTEFILSLSRLSCDHGCLCVHLACRCSSVHKSRRVMKCFFGVCRIGSRAVLWLARQEKCCVFSHPFIRYPLVLFSCPLGRSAKNSSLSISV